MSIIGLLGIAVSLALLIYLAFKGFEAAYVAIFAVIIVAVCNGLDVIPAVTEIMTSSAGGFFSMMAPMFITSCVFAGLFSACGAAQSLANGFAWFFEKLIGAQRRNSYMSGVWVTILVSYFSYVILTFFGLDGMASQITIVPIVIALMKRYNIPRHCAPALLYLNVSGVFIPFSMQTTNMIPALTLGTSTGCGGWPAFLIWLVSAGAAMLYMSWYIKKCNTRGDEFEALPIDDSTGEGRKLPNFFLALVPLVVVFVLFTVVGWHIAISLIIATVVALVIMFPYFNDTAQASNTNFVGLLREKISQEILIAGKILIVVCMLVGFGGVVQSTEVFGQIIAVLCESRGALTIMCAIAICVVILVSCNPVAGEAVALNALSPYFIGAGVPAAVFHRLTVIASTTFDSLPTGIGVIMAHELTGVSMKKGYKPVFVVTVLIPFIGTMLLAVLYTLFPGAV